MLASARRNVAAVLRATRCIERLLRGALGARTLRPLKHAGRKKGKASTVSNPCAHVQNPRPLAGGMGGLFINGQSPVEDKSSRLCQRTSRQPSHGHRYGLGAVASEAYHHESPFAFTGQ